VVAIWLFSDMLGKGTDALANRFHITPSVRGATLDAVASSFPELVTVVVALMAGSFEAGLGAIVGSALFNILIIPAASAMAAGDLRLKDRSVLKRDGLIYMAVVIGLIIAIWVSPSGEGSLHHIPAWVGLAGIILYAGYVTLLAMGARGQIGEDQEENGDDKPFQGWKVALAVMVSMAGIGLSVHYLVDATLVLFRGWGLSDAVAGVTVLAAATSLPDTLLSVFAARRGDADGALTNALGSNSFDILVCLGLPIFMVGGVSVDWNVSWPSLAFLMVATVGTLWFIFTGWTLRRWEGGVMTLTYVAFVVLAFAGVL